MTAVTLRVNGVPAPQGSKRHVGGGRMVEMSKAVGPWREAIRAEAQDAEIDAVEGGGTLPSPAAPVAVTAVFLLPRPKGHFGTGRNAGRAKASAPARPASRPDLDKLLRALLDGLVMGGLLIDDSQVVDLNASKIWAPDGEAPGVIVEVAWDE